MEQNYFGCEAGIQIDTLMSATAWNLKKMMEKLKAKFLQIIFRLFFRKIFITLPHKFCLLRRD
ncbi:MAG: hypothetical protein LBS69_04150 [Prevotellaceae bacterium]|jgi:IS5 family transposase|nr:hypothetical protein [Prevotellaceae bacterium]